MLRSNSKGLKNHVVSPEEEKERLQWEGCAEKGGFMSGMKLMEELPLKELGDTEFERLVRGRRRGAGSRFQRRGEACACLICTFHYIQCRDVSSNQLQFTGVTTTDNVSRIQ